MMIPSGGALLIPALIALLVLFGGAALLGALVGVFHGEVQKRKIAPGALGGALGSIPGVILATLFGAVAHNLPSCGFAVIVIFVASVVIGASTAIRFVCREPI